jgi:hypothetical protein
MHLYWPRLLDGSGVNRQWLGWLLFLMLFWSSCDIGCCWCPGGQILFFPVMLCADCSTLWRALLLWAVQAVGRDTGGDRDRQDGLNCESGNVCESFRWQDTFLQSPEVEQALLCVWTIHFSVMCTPRKLKLSNFLTAVLSMLKCSLYSFLSMIISFVSLILSERLFCWGCFVDTHVPSLLSVGGLIVVGNQTHYLLTW